MPRPNWRILIALLLTLAGCGEPRKSIFPPTVSIQQLEVRPDGVWHLILRIQNNSYTNMNFSAIEGQLKVSAPVALRLHARFDRDIPAFAGDVITLDLLPTREMSAVLAAMTRQGSAGSLTYTIHGTAQALPHQEKTPRDFFFQSNEWLSPVPGIPGTFR